VRDYPTEREEVEMSIEAIAGSNASVRLKEWKDCGFNKADILNVASRVFLWAKVDVPDGRNGQHGTGGFRSTYQSVRDASHSDFLSWGKTPIEKY
jgi:hypothetical protein